MSNVIFNFVGPGGFTPTLNVYREDTLALLGSAVAAARGAIAGHYAATVDVGAYTGDVLASTTSPAGAYYGSTSDGQLRDDPAVAAVILTTEQLAELAAGVYRRLAGGSVGLLVGPTSDSPLDAIHSADLDYTFDAVVDASSSLVFTIKRDPADELAALEIVDDAIVLVNGEAAEFAADGAIVRLSATQCRATIAARTFVELAPGPYSVEFRELTAAGATLSQHEFQLNLRRSASRQIAS